MSTRSGVYVSSSFRSVTVSRNNTVSTDYLICVVCLHSVNVRTIGAPDNILISKPKSEPPKGQ